MGFGPRIVYGDTAPSFAEPYPGLCVRHLLGYVRSLVGCVRHLVLHRHCRFLQMIESNAPFVSSPIFISALLGKS